MLNSEKVQAISLQVIKTLYKRFESFPEDASGIRNAPFHMAFLKAFEDKFHGFVNDIPTFISLSSWFHGLNTTLGQSFFEKSAHILCNGTKQEFKNLKISQNQQTIISDIITELKNSTRVPNLEDENILIACDNSPLDKSIPNFTADCYFEDNTKVIAIEIKTVKPNSGVFKVEKEKILLAKAALKNLFPKKKVSYFLAFPFDPLSKEPTGSNKMAFMNYSVDFTKYFDPREVLLADELWNFLSEDIDTMPQILEIINTIATTEFIEKYDYLNDLKNKQLYPSKYYQQLSEWNLNGEKYLMDHQNTLQSFADGNDQIARKFNQSIFKDGEYNHSRLLFLKELLTNIH